MSKAQRTGPPPSTLLRQQRLQSCQPLLLPKHIVILFGSFGVVFIVIGISLTTVATQLPEVEVEYDRACCANCDTDEARQDYDPCYVNFSVSEDMGPTTYLYFRLENFFANHRQYVRSRDDAQLWGKPDKLPNTLDCRYDKNFAVQGISGSQNTRYSVSGEFNTLANVISPCGLISLAWFNDSFTLLKEGKPVKLVESDIAWETDRKLKFSNAAEGSTGNNFDPFRPWKEANCEDLRRMKERNACMKAELDAYQGWCNTLETEYRDKCKNSDPQEPQAWGNFSTSGRRPGWCYRGSGYCNEDEHFIVWMRTAVLSTARSLYAKIGTKLTKGNYTLKVTSGASNLPPNYIPSPGSRSRLLYPVYPFGGGKSVVLGTLSFLDSGRNATLGVVYLISGAVFLFLALVFLAKNMLHPRKPGTASFLLDTPDRKLA